MLEWQLRLQYSTMALKGNQDTDAARLCTGSSHFASLGLDLQPPSWLRVTQYPFNSFYDNIVPFPAHAQFITETPEPVGHSIEERDICGNSRRIEECFVSLLLKVVLTKARKLALTRSPPIASRTRALDPSMDPTQLRQQLLVEVP